MAQRGWLEQLAQAAGRGRALLGRQAGASPGPLTLQAMCERLLKVRGEAIGLALATNIVDAIRHLTPKEGADFLELLDRRFAPVPDKVEAAIQRSRGVHTDESLPQLAAPVEPPPRQLFPPLPPRSPRRRGPPQPSLFSPHKQLPRSAGG